MATKDWKFDAGRFWVLGDGWVWGVSPPPSAKIHIIRKTEEPIQRAPGLIDRFRTLCRGGDGLPIRTLVDGDLVQKESEICLHCLCLSKMGGSDAVRPYRPTKKATIGVVYRPGGLHLFAGLSTGRELRRMIAGVDLVIVRSDGSAERHFFEGDYPRSWYRAVRAAFDRGVDVLEVEPRTKTFRRELCIAEGRKFVPFGADAYHTEGVLADDR